MYMIDYIVQNKIDILGVFKLNYSNIETVVYVSIMLTSGLKITYYCILTGIIRIIITIAIII